MNICKKMTKENDINFILHKIRISKKIQINLNPVDRQI